MPVSHRWSPIADFDVDPAALTDGELNSLARVWARQKQKLAQDRSLVEFETRLRREWSIETGIIENVFTLDRGVTRTLIEKGIDAALIPHGASNRESTLVARIIQDHYDVLESMFDFVGGPRDLTTGYIRELHAGLLRNQETCTVVDQLGRAFEKPLEKGAYKTTPNSRRGPTDTLTNTALPNTSPPRWTGSSLSMRSTRRMACLWRWRLPGCTIVLHRYIRLPMGTEESHGPSPAWSSSSLDGFH
jgi:hypothetical protein